MFSRFKCVPFVVGAMQPLAVCPLMARRPDRERHALVGDRHPPGTSTVGVLLTLAGTDLDQLRGDQQQDAFTCLAVPSREADGARLPTTQAG